MTTLPKRLLDRASELNSDAEVWESVQRVSEVVCRGGAVERRSTETRDSTAVTTWKGGREGYAIHSPAQGTQLVDQAIAVGEALGGSATARPARGDSAILSTASIEDEASIEDDKSWADVESVLVELSASPEADIELRGRADEFQIALQRLGRRAHAYSAVTCEVQARITARSDTVGFLSHSFHGPRRERVLTELRSGLPALVHLATILSQTPTVDIEHDAVLIDGRVMSSLLDLVLPAFQLDSVLEGRSPLADRVGDVVSTPGVSFVDHSLAQDSPLRSPWDDEGMSAKETVLVRDGILESFINSRRTAAEAGLPTSGNGWRGSSGEMPTVQFSFVQLKLADALSRRRPGGRVLRVVQANGAHISNSITGDFSIGANAVLQLADGRIANAGKVTVAGNAFDMLGRIKGGDGVIAITGGPRSFSASPGLWIDGLVIGN